LKRARTHVAVEAVKQRVAEGCLIPLLSTVAAVEEWREWRKSRSEGRSCIVGVVVAAAAIEVAAVLAVAATSSDLGNQRVKEPLGSLHDAGRWRR